MSDYQTTLEKKIYITQVDHHKPELFRNVKKWYFLSDDYEKYQYFVQKKPDRTKIMNMASKFEQYYERVKHELLKIIESLALKNDNVEWWSGQVASHTSTGSDVMRNIVYTFFAAEIIKKTREPILIICPSSGVARSLKKFCHEKSFKCNYTFSIIKSLKKAGYHYLKMMAGIIQFLYDFANLKINIHQLKAPSFSSGKIVILRTWLTGDTLTDDPSEYRDRNFGALIDFLNDNGYTPLIIPLIFNTGVSAKSLLKKMSLVDMNFLLPSHLLGVGSCLSVIMFEVKRYFTVFQGIIIDELDITGIIRCEVKKTSFGRSLMTYNLIYPLIKRLNEKGVKISHFIYPFENNAPEKLFIIAKKSFYPESLLVGFQHTVITSNQLGMVLGDTEYHYHPLPDRIVCSGSVWRNKLVKNNFPSEILKDGPSLRFEHIRRYEDERVNRSTEHLIFFIALPYSKNIAYELIHKVSTASSGIRCTVNIKPHPLLNLEKLKKYIKSTENRKLKIVEGTPYLWFKKSDVAFEAGSSVTQLEAVSCGIPLIRVIPDNFFNFDPMDWLEYPILPACNILEIRENIHKALKLSDDDLKRMSEKVKKGCFSEVSNDSMEIFLVNKKFGGMQ